MKKVLVLLLAFGVLLLGVTLLAAHEGEQRETVTAAEQAEVKQGEHSCGEQHVKCVLFCAELGMPLGVLEEDTEQIYLVLPPGHDDPKGMCISAITARPRGI